MIFTLNTHQIHQDTLVELLKITAASNKTDRCWKVYDNIPVKKALDQLQAQILKTDDKNLIALFRRAVRNHDTIHPTEQANPVPLFNKHYEKPPFLIPNTNIILDVREDKVKVVTFLEIIRSNDQESLILDAENHQVEEISINEVPVTSYTVTEHEIIIDKIPLENSFLVKIISTINPFENKSLQGLYKSGEWLTTQCEPEGARRIFPTIDRPDVLSRYTTTLIANPDKYPCCISNGNLIEKTDMTTTWEDPFPKPSYLFATVMGDFGILRDTYTTRSGREVSLEVYMEKGKEKRAEFSLSILKKAMEFEEEYFDREYDLNSLKMVAIPDFNAGAMENKGLMVFNESCLLVDPDCATDSDYFWVALVISHEYCHNWSGNRVTVRNWFELALKEAFTDFRASQFMNHMYGEEHVRPSEAKILREKQFHEDALPSAHPIQVESFVDAEEIFDSTTYVKGREVFGMLKTILDDKEVDGFKKAQNAYFDRYDGQAVTFKELLTTLEEVSGVDLKQFERWFHQPGTPTVNATCNYIDDLQEVHLNLEQTCFHPKTKELQDPLYIPLYVELLDYEGNILAPKQLLNINERSQRVVIINIDKEPIPVFHHGFCAPIHMKYTYTDEELEVILQSEKDPFARKEAGELYLKRILAELYEEAKSIGKANVTLKTIDFFKKTLKKDPFFFLSNVEMLHLPSIRSIIKDDTVYNIEAAAIARKTLSNALADGLETIFLDQLNKFKEPSEYHPNEIEMTIRKLRNSCYTYLSSISETYNDLIFDAYEKATNFNNQFALLNIIIKIDDPRRETVLDAFFEKWKKDGTILNNWIEAQTGAYTCTVQTLDKIFNNPYFIKTNPDHMRSLIRTFVNNLEAYHKIESYAYVTDRIIEFSLINPMVASSYLANEAFKDYAHLPDPLKSAMKTQLERLAAPDRDQSLRSIAAKYL